MSDTLYEAPLDHVKDMVRKVSKVNADDVQVWACPCGCSARVAFAHAPDGKTWFMATHTFQAEPPYPTHGVEEVADLHDLIKSNEKDGILYGIWLAVGLREAMFGERTGLLL